ncbi:MAG: ParA family protein [Nitrosomonadales bacterium]|nr:ParA family protein [Nitrosomonadales bacterium]
MTIIAIYNQKGGVGKTTTSLNLAAALAKSGRNVVCIDLDPQAQLSDIAGVTAESGNDTVLSMFERNRSLHELLRKSASGFQVIPAHGSLSKVDVLHAKNYNVVNRLKASLRGDRLGDNADVVIIDCSPMIGVLSLNALFACDLLLIPIAADHLSMKGGIKLEKTLKALEPILKRRIDRRYLLTRFDSRRRMGWEVLHLLEEKFGREVCSTSIAESVSLAESPALHMSVYQHAPTSRGAQDYEDLLRELETLKLIR